MMGPCSSTYFLAKATACQVQQERCVVASQCPNTDLLQYVHCRLFQTDGESLDINGVGLHMPSWGTARPLPSNAVVCHTVQQVSWLADVRVAGTCHSSACSGSQTQTQNKSKEMQGSF